MATVGIGARVKRKEDLRLITGTATYTDDIKLPGMVYAAFVRSPYAHARVRSVSTAAARKLPGVIEVFTHQDLRPLWQAPLPCAWAAWPTLKNPAHWPLAADKVCHVGEAVAVVVAADRDTARDAAQLLEVEYDPLPAVVDLEEAAGSAAARIHDELADNIAYTFQASHGAVADAFLRAPVKIRQRYLQQRILGAAMEPRAVVVQWHPFDQEMTIWSTTQVPHFLRLFASVLLGVPEHRLRVVAPEVGGGFGSKLQVYAEEIACGAVAMKLGRPVKWAADRSEDFLSTHQGRQGIMDFEVAAESDGRVTAMRLNWLADMGAYNMVNGPYVPLLGYIIGTGPYKVSNFECNITGVFTTTTPTDAIRGAGRPEATYWLERTMDLLAAEVGLDPAEVRRRNLPGPEEFPFTNGSGLVYDTGNYPRALEKALEAVGYEEIRRQQLQQRQSGNPGGKLLGIGISTYVEACGLAPAAATAGTLYGAALWDSAQVRVHHTGKVTVYTGASPHGQGHETSFAQIVSERLGVPFEDVEIAHGDTARGPMGTNTYGSRSLVVAGVALYKALDKIRAKAARIAAFRLECPAEEIEFSGAALAVRGAADRSVSFQEIAAAANLGAHERYPAGLEPGLEATCFFTPENFSFPFGTHVCVVEVDPETGRVAIQKYVAVDDCGNVVNPLIVEGQIHGGIAMGIAQALFEEYVYDRNGQPVTASFLDYAVPTAADLPAYDSHLTVTPATTNPLGAKGIGEAGTIASTPAVVNAVVDALSHLGVRHIDMPLRPERVWRAIQKHGR